MSIGGRLPKMERHAALDDPFLVELRGEPAGNLGQLIDYGLDQPEDYPAGYCGPTNRDDPRFDACRRRHRARKQSRGARCGK